MTPRGYLVLSILWHLFEDGIATPAELAHLIGRPREYILCALRKMHRAGTVLAYCDETAVGFSPGARYGLTHAGINAAMQVRREDIEVAA